LDDPGWNSGRQSLTFDGNLRQGVERHLEIR
jgi:hypothetical protein